ncbi:MAG: type II secretion system F family protein [Rickettsiales bacterium]|nr:type II secretion system F family protein [Rickettsiales bacterium]
MAHALLQNPSPLLPTQGAPRQAASNAKPPHLAFEAFEGLAPETDNAQAPVSTEFKQVADEVAFGSTLIEALQRMTYRIDEQDVRFFVVVLGVQQDVGGNLSEVLNNLSNIIRKRKHMRMKIKALASEGRATAWVLGSMPFAEAGLILLISPDHLDPLFNTPLGHTILGITAGIVALGIFTVRQMVNIKV